MVNLDGSNVGIQLLHYMKRDSFHIFLSNEVNLRPHSENKIVKILNKTSFRS